MVYGDCGIIPKARFDLRGIIGWVLPHPVIVFLRCHFSSYAEINILGIIFNRYRVGGCTQALAIRRVCRDSIGLIQGV